MAQLEAVGFDPFKSKATPEDFAARYGSAAEKAGKALGVDPNVILGQWGLETGWGKSVIPGTNNLGNIKDFSGSGVAATDNMTGSRDKYRQYESPEAFADDFVGLIQRKYAGAMNAGADPAKFTAGLKGYAEDPRYADKVAQATRMASNRKGPIAQTLDRVTDAVVPTAQAATLEPVSAPPQLEAVDFNPFAKKEESSAGKRLVSGAIQGTKDLAGGLVRGAGSIGATLMAPIDVASDALGGKGLTLESNRQRRADMDSALQNLGVDTSSLAFQGGKLASEVAGTAGVGNALAIPARAAGATKLANALASGGMTVGGAPAQTVAQGAQNLLTRVAGGAGSGAAAAGLVNPEDAGTGALIGGALPVATKVAGTVGNKLGAAIRGPEVAPNVRQAVQAAQDVGYVIPPTQAKPTLGNRLIEGAAGKITTAQNASARNQEVTNRLAKAAIGAQELTPEGLAAVRANANKAYDALGSAGAFQADDAFRSAMEKVGAAGKQLKADFPEVVNKDVEALVESFAGKGQFDAQSAIEAIKRLRSSANANRIAQDPEKVALGKVQGKISNALEDLIDRNLASSGRQDLLESYRAARQTLAKTYDVEKALNPATGNVDAKKLGNALKKGRLTGELKQIGEFASSFPKAAQSVESMGSLPQLSPLDWATAGGISAATGSPLGALGLVARPAARAAALSPVVQNRLASGAGRIPLEMSVPMQELFYKGTPVALTGGR